MKPPAFLQSWGWHFACLLSDVASAAMFWHLATLGPVRVLCFVLCGFSILLAFIHFINFMHAK